MNNITKIVIKSLYVMLFILLLTTTSAAATTVSIANVTAEPGDTVTLPIMINNITELWQRYDKDLVRSSGGSRHQYCRQSEFHNWSNVH